MLVQPVRSPIASLRGWLCILSLVLVGACQSPVRWTGEEPAEDVLWFGRRAYPLGQDIVLAGSHSSAAQIAEEIMTLRAALTRELKVELGPVLWIAMGPKDESIASHPAELQTLLGREDNSEAVPDTLASGEGQPEFTAEEKAEVLRIAIRSMAMGLDLDVVEIGLPPSLIARTDGAVLYPTEKGLMGVSNDLLNIMTSKFGFVKRAALKAMRGRVVREMAEQYKMNRQAELLRWLEGEGAHLLGTTEAPDRRRAALHRALELQYVEDQSIHLSVGEYWQLPTTFHMGPGTQGAQDFPGAFSLSFASRDVKVEGDLEVDTSIRAENYWFFDALSGVPRGSITFGRKGPIERDDLDAFFDLLGTEPRHVLLSGSNHATLATIATLHAIERGGFTQAQAQSLWKAYGMPHAGDLSFQSIGKYLRQN